MVLDLVAVPAAVDDAPEQMLGLRGGAEMDLRGLHAQNGPRPGVAPVGVGDHLALVDDGHVIAGFQIQLFGRGGDVGVLLPAVLLLAGGEAAIHACVQQCLLGLQGEQAQGGQVDARPGLL